MISEAALWGLSSLLLPPSLRGRPPRSDVAAVNQSAPAAPRGGGLKGTLAPRPQDPEPGASRSLPNRAAWCWAPGWEPAWFRLEGREERARGPDAPRGSHPRLDIQDRNPIAAARPAHPALHDGSGPGLGHFQTTGVHQAPAAGSPPAHEPFGAAHSPERNFFVCPLSGSQAPTLPRCSTQPTDHAQHTFSHLHAPASTRCYRALGTVATARTALSGQSPSAHRPLLVGAQRAAGAGPGWRASESAPEVTGGSRP